MNYIVATDLDGTLLDDSGEVSTYTKSVITRLLETGISIIPCTARSVSELPKGLLETDIRYFVCTNGSVIYDRETESVVKSYLLDSKVAFDILDRLDLTNVFVNLIHEGQVYSEYRFYDAYFEAGLLKQEWIDSMQRSRISVESTYEKLKEVKKLDKLHMNFLTKEDRDRVKDEIGFSDDFIVQYSDDLNLEITNKSSNKGISAKYVMKLLNAESKMLLSFGDNYNDIPLLNAADISVRMSNGVSELKNHATDVTDFNNHEDGVVKYILKTLFE